MLLRLAAVALAALAGQSLAFNNPEGVDIWCGKAYRATNASFEPGGWLSDPEKSTVPLLDLKIRPRMTLYLDTDTEGSFLVDAGISYLVGQPYTAAHLSYGQKNKSTKLKLEITSNGEKLSLNDSLIEVDTVDNEIIIDLALFPPASEPYNISVSASPVHGNGTVFTATTELLRLPSRDDGGSVTRLDNLYGGLSVRKGNETEWSLIFPYTYYVQWSLYWYANLSTLDEFSSMGYNVIHIVPTGDLGETPFPWDEFEPYLDRADELGIYFQYDVRWEYANLSIMIDQVTRLRSHPSILLWYTGDEPDGKSNPINSTGIAYQTVRSLDLYHPVSLALNCYNFYYEDYASGAEIILSDVYPISNNVTWSTVYETPCNTTYGCCGCDDCKGSFEDISERLDNFAHFDDLIGWPKTHWGAPQAFGNETFWTRYPTAAEEVVMNILSINHAAKGIVMWDFPTKADVLEVTNQLAAVLTTSEIADFLLGTPITQTLDVTGASRVDAAAWTGDKQILLSIVNLNYGNIANAISVELPKGIKARSISSTLWGDAKWEVKGNKVTTKSLLGLQASILVLELA
ncbi:putative glycoside hydrolase subgroup catalytic core [Phaeomoniella chlamydospora]|uniref:Putative glycoside hydrolase subgroup catalytic core n=1 Tax=Phaeomoniella chlamydospora TaxID=158046 RepID=A0A0G2FV32_PHACM|nr:putative glycoside hydrolase subgroup catalytic core [Phaeomoniella chlamydospora]